MNDSYGYYDSGGAVWVDPNESLFMLGMSRRSISKMKMMLTLKLNYFTYAKPRKCDWK